MTKEKKRLVGLTSMDEMFEKSNSKRKFVPQEQLSSQSDGIENSTKRVSRPSDFAVANVHEMGKNTNNLKKKFTQPEQLISLSEVHVSSNDVPSGSKSSQKTTRGLAQFPKEWGTRKLQVTLDRKGNLVGNDYHKLASALGCLARSGSKFSLKYKRFPEIPSYQKDMVWEEVERNTTLPPDAKEVVMSTINSLWRNWKSEIKHKYWYPNRNDEEYLKQVPDDRIQMDQWLFLQDYWKDPDVQEVAVKNAKNVENRLCPPRTGRTSIPMLEQELRMQGIDPTRLDIWIESRSRGKGVGDDDLTSDFHDHFTRELAKKTEEERTAEFKEKLFENAMGKEKNGRDKCKGKGTKLTQSHMSTTSTSRMSPHDIEEFQKFKGEFSAKMEEVEKLKEGLRLAKEQTESLNQRMEFFLSKFPTSSTSQNEDQLLHEASLSTSHCNGSKDHMTVQKDTMTIEKPKTVGHQKLAMHTKSALPNGDQEATVEINQKNFGHQKLAMQKKSALPNGCQFSHETSLQTSRFNGSKDTTTVEKQKAMGQQKLAMQKKLFFDNIEIGSAIALFCFGLPKSIVAEGLLLTRGDDNGLCKVYIKKVLIPHEKVKSDKNGLTVGEAEDKCVLWDIANVAKL